jgi:hypothetical protein
MIADVRLGGRCELDDGVKIILTELSFDKPLMSYLWLAMFTYVPMLPYPFIIRVAISKCH